MDCNRTEKGENMAKEIIIKGASENNLRDLDVTIPRINLLCLRDSGSGKSSLAFDTIYAEGRRRYMESLSSYAVNFGTDGKTQGGIYRGLSPAISIDQKTTSRIPLYGGNSNGDI